MAAQVSKVPLLAPTPQRQIRDPLLVRQQLLRAVLYHWLDRLHYLLGLTDVLEFILIIFEDIGHT